VSSGLGAILISSITAFRMMRWVSSISAYPATQLAFPGPVGARRDGRALDG
jgi:hypothetical protein